MKRALIIIAVAVIPFTASAATVDRISVYATGGKSVTTWHGQADVQALNVELTRELSPHTDFAFVFAPMNLWQPRSWFGEQYGDGNESAKAISGSLLLRRRFFTSSTRAEMYLEGSSGPMWADKRVPAATSRFNFVSQAGAGFVLAPQARFPVIVGYRFMHISNGGYAPRNPGLNVSAITIGTRLRSAMRR